MSDDEVVKKKPASAADHLSKWHFKPGVSGNPSGRPRGARNKLSGDFIDDLYADFKAHGKWAIAEMRTTKPAEYVKIIAHLLPQHFDINVNKFEDMSEDQLRDRIKQLDAILQIDTIN